MPHLVPRFFDKLEPPSDEIMKPGEIDVIAQDVMDDSQREKFAEVPEMNLAISRAGPGRYRVNIFNSAIRPLWALAESAPIYLTTKI